MSKRVLELRARDCPICLGPLGMHVVLEQMMKSAVQTECNHIFHEVCISDWVQKSNECPMCRAFVADDRFKSISL